MVFENIALFGADGSNIGHHVLQALVNNITFSVTMIARAASKTTYPESVSVIKINDFDLHAKLVNALKGQDVLISAIGLEGNAIQYKLIDAAIEAGVQRVFPSEWGCDNDDPANRDLSPSFAAKHQVAEYLRSKESAKFSWTAVATSIWIEWYARQLKAGVLLPESSSNFETLGKQPLLEQMDGVDLPKPTLQEVVREWLAGQL